jgi:hypothetical protein
MYRPSLRNGRGEIPTLGEVGAHWGASIVMNALNRYLELGVASCQALIGGET